MAIQMIAAGRVTSAVVDEPAHLAAGWLALTEGDLTVNREHPPLVKLLAALPLLALSPKSPPPGSVTAPRASEDFAFAYSRELLYHANDADRLLRAARLSVILLTLMAGLVVFLWTRSIAGAGPALVALALFAFEPNLLAHGRLVTTDMAASLFVLMSAACLERSLSGTGRPLRWASAAGVGLGLGLLSRFSLALMIPLLIVMAACDTRAPLAARLKAAGMAILVSLLVLNAAYGFTGSPFPLASDPVADSMISSPLASMEADAALRWMPLPVPRLWIEGLDLARYKNRRVEGPTYLNGRLSDEGFWSYFVLALGMKTTVPLLLLGLAGLVIILWRSRREAGLAAHCVVPLIGLLAAVSALTRAQIGIRYVLPVVPLLCIAGAVAGRDLLAGTGRRRVVGIAGLVLLVGWHAGAALAVHPYHLAHMNLLAGGPDRQVPRLADSNLDWGQDLIGLKRFMKERGLESINLYYFGTADPDYYGIKRNVPPRPGWFAVSVTHLVGVYLPDPGYLAPFMRMVPDATIGHSIRLYRLDEVPEFLRRPIRTGPSP